VSKSKPSPIFLAIVLATAAAGLVAWQSDGKQLDRARYAVFAFVLLGWIVSLCLHEFAHALLAYRGGDKSVADKGYLTLDPRKYVHPGLSLLLPLVFLLMGGIGLPGGAVWIQPGAIRTKAKRSWVSAAGPLSNLALGLVLSIPFRLFPNLVFTAPVFASALAFLITLQFIAAVLNALPIPGLDGFGVLEPHLPKSFLESIAPYRQYSFIILFVLMTRAPWFGDNFYTVVNRIFTYVTGGRDVLDAAAVGYRLFRFWDQ
jgi:Zn-dependent protease